MSVKTLNSFSKVDYILVSVCEDIRQQHVFPIWTNYKEEELWFTLVTCLLGSRVSYDLSLAVATRLRNARLLTCYNETDMVAFERRLLDELSRPISWHEERRSHQRYRFPISRARYLRETYERIYGKGNSISGILVSSSNSTQARIKLISLTVGIGPKQASLFLRNIGFASDLAILDSHVLRFMRWRGLLVGVSSKVSTLCQYESIEHALRSYASCLGCPLSYLDLAIWVVMRVLKRGLDRELGYLGLRRLGLSVDGLLGEGRRHYTLPAFH